MFVDGFGLSPTDWNCEHISSVGRTKAKRELEIVVRRRNQYIVFIPYTFVADAIVLSVYERKWSVTA